MKVLLIDVNCQKSSTGKIVYDLYQWLRADGHEAAICYGRGEIVEGENIFKFGLDWETNVHTGLARLTGLNGCFSRLSTKRLLKFIDDFAPDVVHIHELHAYFVNITPLLNHLKKRKVKIIWTFHCEYMYTGKCGYAYECEKWRTECGHCPRIEAYPKSLIFDFTRRMFREKKAVLSDMDIRIVTPSAWLADRVKQSFLKNKDVRVIHNGIDTKMLFYPKEPEKVAVLKEKFGLGGKKIVLSVAPNIMNERKGGQTVLELSKEFLGQDIHFVMVGADRSESAGENVTLIQRTANQEELALWYSAADVFLICSKRENFPTTCLEAFCCGTPVVGIDAGGTKETVPAPYGAFFQPGDTEGLIQGIHSFLAADMPSAAIGAEGQKLYDKKVMYQAYLTLYRDETM